MNVKCSFCQTPFAIGRLEKLAALQHMEAESLNHYDVHCPRCRRATPVLRQKLEISLPNWRDALHELEQQAESAPASGAKPGPSPALASGASVDQTQGRPASAPQADSKPGPAKHHRTRAGSKKETVSATPAKGKKKNT